MSQELAPGFGRILAEAREAKGISVADVAEKLKLTVRQIEALEAEDFSRLPAAVFVRGFVRNYARLVEVSMDSLPGMTEPAVEPSSTITAPSEGVTFRTSPVRRWLLLPLAGLILFLILVAVLYNWLRQGEDAYLSTPAPAQSSVHAVPVPAAAPIQRTPPTPEPAAPAIPVQPAQPEPSTVPANTPAQTSHQSSVPAPAAAPVHPASVAPVAAPVSKPAPVAPAQTSSLAPAKPAAPASTASAGVPTGSHQVSFSAQGESSWIEVLSSDKQRYSKLLQPGERWAVRGMPPLQVVVGNAAHVEVSYDAKPVDMKPQGDNKVARVILQ